MIMFFLNLQNGPRIVLANVFSHAVCRKNVRKKTSASICSLVNQSQLIVLSVSIRNTFDRIL